MGFLIKDIYRRMNVKLKEINSLNFESEIIQGIQAIRFLDNREFINNWNSLLKNAVVSSIFQDASFVIPWYKNNLDNFHPVVLSGYSDNKLVALLTLAQRIDKNTGEKSNKLEGAGGFSALFQTWLVLPGFQEIFWIKGIKEVLKTFQNAQINLKSLPNSTAIKSLENRPEFKSITTLEKHQNPILNYKNQDYKQVLNKRHFRSKYNRLKRAGEVKLERVDSSKRFNQILIEISTFHDLRQGAAFNIIPFGNDTELKKTFEAWFENGLLYASLLILDEQIIGAIFFINEYDKILHLAGLVTYSPFHAKYSPGLVHLYLLGFQIQKEGFESINLSPGYDSYKERFSNQHEEIYELLISQNSLDIYKRKLRYKFRQILLGRGIRPMDFQVFLSKKKSVIKNRLQNFRKNHKRRNHDSKNIVLEWAKNQIAIARIDNNLNIEHNNMNNLLLTGEFDFNICRWEFLEDALKRLEDGQDFFTHVKNDRLIWCIWFKNSSEKMGEFEGSVNIKEVFVSKAFVINSLDTEVKLNK